MANGTRTHPSAILYQNEAKTVTLLDLPRSISLAQHPHLDTESSRQLLSSAGPIAPYPSTEPKSEKARQKLLVRMGPGSPYAKEYEDLIKEGLVEVQERHRGEWCLPRRVAHEAERGRKRKASAVTDEPQDEPPQPLEPNLSFDHSTRPKAPWILATASTENTASSTSSVAQRLLVNPNHSFSTLGVAASPEAVFHVPGRASFFLDTITPASAERWSAAVAKHLAHPTASAGPGQFDFVVLDPPWNNRSAKRAGAYGTAWGDDRPMDAVVDVLGRHLAPAALVACWVTNGAGSRTEAFRAFADWDVRLVEEWVWVKTTTRGEPVTSVGGIWRKPYEVLLIGRKRAGDEVYPTEDVAEQEQVVRRLIVAVPDLHSRKPCLRELLEPLMPEGDEYRALEIFARYLSHGWSVWGDEVLKFNWTGCWRETGSNESLCDLSNSREEPTNGQPELGGTDRSTSQSQSCET